MTQKLQVSTNNTDFLNHNWITKFVEENIVIIVWISIIFEIFTSNAYKKKMYTVYSNHLKVLLDKQA